MNEYLILGFYLDDHDLQLLLDGHHDISHHANENEKYQMHGKISIIKGKLLLLQWILRPHSYCLFLKFYKHLVKYESLHHQLEHQMLNWIMIWL